MQACLLIARRPQPVSPISGTLEQMFEHAAQLEIRALEQRLMVMLTLLEPVMILAIGAVVVMIVLASFLPSIEINQLAR